MQIRTLTVFIVISVSPFLGLLLFAETDNNLSEIRVEQSEIDLNGDGEPEAITRKFFRGRERIMSEVTQNRKTARIYYLNGKERFGESDEDGDGFFELLRIFGDTSYEYELFTRSLNGDVTAMKTEDLLNIISAESNAYHHLGTFIKRIKKGVEK